MNMQDKAIQVKGPKKSYKQSKSSACLSVPA